MVLSLYEHLCLFVPTHAHKYQALPGAFAEDSDCDSKSDSVSEMGNPVMPLLIRE